MNRIFGVIIFLALLVVFMPQAKAVSDVEFFELVKKGKPEQVQEVVNKGVDVNLLFENGFTPLIVAAKWNENPEVIDILLKAGADGAIKCPEGKTAYDYASENEPLYFSDLYDKLYFAMKGGFMYLVIHGDPEEIKKAIEEGSDPNMRDESNRTAFMNAAGWNENPEVIELLIDEGADVNARDDFGGTVLMEAAIGNSPKVVRLLIEAGADIKARTEDGMSALMYAAGFNQNPDVIKVLLEKGANINARNQRGFTPLIYAAWFTENPKIIDILLEHGADGKAECVFGDTAFDYGKENEAIVGTDVYWRLHDAQFD